MTLENYIVMAVGVIVLVLGVILIRNRVKVFEFFTDAFGAFGGTSARQAISKGSSPFWIGFVGVGAMVIGVVAILMGIFARK